MALISMRFRSCARIVAFCFFVPKVSPSAFLASRYWGFDGAADEGIDFKALTVWVKIWGVLGSGRTERDPVRLLWTARRYLNSHWHQPTRHKINDNWTRTDNPNSRPSCFHFHWIRIRYFSFLLPPTTHLLLHCLWLRICLSFLVSFVNSI